MRRIGGSISNPTLDLIERRRSTRVYDPTPLTANERAAVLHAALRAPTAGGMVLYSIIEIVDQALKDRLAITCDDQPFIAKAPWVLVFVADYQKWIDLFEASGCLEAGHAARTRPALGDLLLACSDALIAAQTAVIAAESLAIGSCYIGDVLENAEEHAELLELPAHTLPIAMVCFGRSQNEQAPIEHFGEHLVHRDRYRRMDAAELAAVATGLERLHAPHGLPAGVTSYPEAVYRRKFTSAYMDEMNRSVAWWLERWQGG